MFYQSIEIVFGKFLVLLGNGHYPIDGKKQLKNSHNKRGETHLCINFHS